MTLIFIQGQVVQEIKNLYVHFLSNYEIGCNKFQYVTTICWFFEAHAEFLWPDWYSMERSLLTWFYEIKMIILDRVGTFVNRFTHTHTKEQKQQQQKNKQQQQQNKKQPTNQTNKQTKQKKTTKVTTKPPPTKKQKQKQKLVMIIDTTKLYSLIPFLNDLDLQ